MDLDKEWEMFLENPNAEDDIELCQSNDLQHIKIDRSICDERGNQ